MLCIRWLPSRYSEHRYWARLYIWALEVYVNWMMVLGSSGERLDISSSCLAGGGTARGERGKLRLVRNVMESVHIAHDSVTFTQGSYTR
ncbi:hypothetical protein EYF80_062451 [Liparis tanakae]|uniref:Uncharacterized protein n=1 Tax=Liparis tanakae TaxID=230148 RepID=A0A4Z2EFC4_9TELE|nr:hypothetical protein EYF80_062451 [Liparis tanakae]